MAKRRGIRIEEKEKQIICSRTCAKGIECVTARLKCGELLLLEERLRRIRIVAPECHADDLFSGRHVRRARAFALRAYPLRDQPPGEFIDLRIRINSRRGQELFELQVDERSEEHTSE